MAAPVYILSGHLARHPEKRQGRRTLPDKSNEVSKIPNPIVKDKIFASGALSAVEAFWSLCHENISWIVLEEESCGNY
ncbi:unnamed protein product [Macrosiphum euphorbiae]|uniref:Uncharacterized protein n=1 Tax=Macrosiphum euphorbiae TaxID=13131 RepID=A0AAV0X773_9HEMI|nr:unnamed protein product [Macrosiphum euphorbiae]